MNARSLLYLWDRRSLFIGRLSAPLSLKQGAACLIVSLEKPIYFRADASEPYREVQSVLTPAACDHEVDTRGQLVANCMLDPFGEDYAMLRSLMDGAEVAKNGACFESPYTQVYRSVFKEIYDTDVPFGTAYEMLDSALQTGVSIEDFEYRVDPRIEMVVYELKKRVHENLSIEDLAKLANVSVSRLSQLFRQQTGIPIRRYRCWHRLFVASVMMAKTGSLTNAAMVAGFSDASHFNKTFQAMMGMCPSLLLSGPHRVQLLVE